MSKKSVNNAKVSLEARLEEALKECERLRSENARLKKMLQAFSLQSTSSLIEKSARRSDGKNASSRPVYRGTNVSTT
ncbi:hypothetical protein ACFL1X_11605 [Candidatus Hydrogenedentota bacterium]